MFSHAHLSFSVIDHVDINVIIQIVDEKSFQSILSIYIFSILVYKQHMSSTKATSYIYICIHTVHVDYLRLVLQKICISLRSHS